MGTKISAFPTAAQLTGSEIVLMDQAGVTSTASSAALGGIIPQTAAETAAGVTPTNYSIPAHVSIGDIIVERYGADPTGANDSGPAFRAACLVAGALGGGRIVARGGTYLFNTWDTTSFYSTNNLALFLLPANTELAGGGQFYTKLSISQTARTGMYAAGANRTHIIGMAKSTGGQYVHDLEFDWNGIVQAASNDYCYDVRTCSANCIIERCYSAQAPITNAICDSSTDTANGNSPLGPTIVRDCWFQDSGPNMTGNGALSADCSYIYLAAPGSVAYRNQLFNSAIAVHNCGGIEMHCAQYYSIENYIKNCWPGMYVGVENGVTISLGSVISRNYIGYCVSGVNLVDQHEGLKIVDNYFEANCDSAGEGFGYGFTDIFTPLASATGVNSAGVQTALTISRNTFDQTLFRQGTARATTETASTGTTSINLSAVTGLNIDHNCFVAATPNCIEIAGSVTGADQSVTIEENQFLDCMDIAGTNAYIMVYIVGASGWASGPTAHDVFIRRNHLQRSTSYPISVTTIGYVSAGGTPAGTLTNVRFEGNDCDNVSAAIGNASITATGQLSVNGLDQYEFALADAATIPTEFVAIACSSAASYTGLIMAPGLTNGQVCTVVNLNANAQTMAASTTSNVSNGTACVIAGSTSLRFTWVASPALWYPG